MLRNVWNRLLGDSMVVTGILPNNMRFPSPECYTTFWRMTNTMTPSIDEAIHQFLTLLLIWNLLKNLTFYLIVWSFHRTFATGAASQQRTLTPPETWSCPTLGLACVLMSRPISPQLVLFPDFWVTNIPRYFCFAFQWIAILFYKLFWVLFRLVMVLWYVLDDLISFTFVTR